jgi:Zn-dependent peptidase ImmA (M78 family)
MTTPSFRSALPCGANKSSIEAFASKFAKNFGFEPGQSIDKVVERLGGRIVYQSFGDLGQTAEESIRVFSMNNFEISLPDYTSPERDRFSIAHEIGHYILHFPLDSSQPMAAARYGSNRVEWEANWFAAGFLMPAVIFKKKFTRCGGSLADVARYFKVSYAAARARAKSLSLI